MKKIGFVTSWYGDDISGGAEAMLRDLTENLHKQNIPVEILTTCVKDFRSDWNKNYYREGTSINKNGIKVKRFRVRKRNTDAFNEVNIKFMKNITVTPEEERIFLREMVNSTALYRYMKENSDNYSLFVFIPYMFGTTYWGMKLFPEKSILIPCLHDEPYAYMKHFRKLFPQSVGMVFNSEPEKNLAEKIYDLHNTKTLTAGIGMNTNITAEPENFRKKYSIKEPFILYAGRKDKGKNIDKLIKYHNEYIRRNNKNLRLVLIGGGETIKGRNIIDLGYISQQDKYNAMSACEFLCQPSMNESFSLVIMENWLCKRPVLVHDGCEVTKNFVSESNGGLYFGNYPEFEACTDYLLKNRKICEIMGLNGIEYVKSHFTHEIVTRKYMEFFKEISNKN
ncbi:MAG: glycosyltransferase family 4 protein [Ruminococcus sp.]|nr:glycosyltransferase family 4 protein [Ruminococcus sp.]MDE6848399.1 glycosyltransferase family 4 protein [Ruminococcus sp.]MDE7138016.1 glycosyltransferase family 4 protein [Ruminococcus sp.]